MKPICLYNQEALIKNAGEKRKETFSMIHRPRKSHLLLTSSLKGACRITIIVVPFYKLAF